MALFQAKLVQSLLADELYTDHRDRDLPICIYTTSGDKLKGELAEFGGKGLFTKELEAGLAAGEIDIAVHSMKDVPTGLQAGHKIGAILKREDPRDAFISPRYGSIAELPEGANVGTASLRRRAQLAAIRPDINFSLLRGNVGTRLSKLEAGDCDATFLAYAGLKRLGRQGVATQIIEPEQMLNAPAQGAIGIELMDRNDYAAEAIAPLNHMNTMIAVMAERAFLKALDGSCRTPIAALAEVSKGKIHMRGEQLSDDGQRRFMRDGFIHKAGPKTALRLGLSLGQSIANEIQSHV